MLTVNILCIGKLKEQYWRDACEEYQKRLGAFCKLNVMELPEYKLPSQPSEAQIAKGIEEEGNAILAKLQRGYHFALCIESKQQSSEQFSQTIQTLALEGESELNFIIGGSFGLSSAVKQQVRQRFSMSQMTFPHQLARILLLEQIYRAFQIAHHGKYHK